MNSISFFLRGKRASVIRWLFTVSTPLAATAQETIPGIGPDSVTTVAARGFAAGGFHRSMLGDNYRDLWTLPIKVPVFHLERFAGGLTPYRIGGGNQTKSLRMLAADSVEYVFRPIYKSGIRLPEDFRGTVAWWVFHDAGSASHPAANVAAVPLMESQQILNPHARLVFMPDDPRLGEFRKEFGNVLGTIEEYPTSPVTGRSYANAVRVLEAEDLLAAIDKSPAAYVDAKKLLRARLIDLLIGDNDRHADQWRWAQLTPGGPFEPIPRDRDKVFLSYEGKLLDLARMVAPSLVKYDSVYSNPTALFENATEFDRRLLGGLDKEVWQSTAEQLRREVTDDLIARTIGAMPREYAARSANLVAKFRYRRDHLPEAAMRYYAQLFELADIHATDTSETATVTRQPDGSVDVSIRTENGPVWFQRHYDPADTRKIRIYLHGGDDRAVVTGNVATSIPIRIIGGNGTNTLTDESVVAGRRNQTRFHDQGTVTNVKYGPDVELEAESYVDALNAYHNRRPLVHAFGTLVPPRKDYGTKFIPVAGLKTGHGLGLVPRIGIARYAYGFRKLPYASMLEADVGYSTGKRGWKVNLNGDKRFESSDIHLPARAMMSEIEVNQFRGFGNDIEDNDDPFFDVHQRQWLFRPALGVSFARESDISLGPVFRYTTTDSLTNSFISTDRPYGFGKFSQAGLQLALNFDSRVRPDTMKPRVTLEASATSYPGMWDAGTAYHALEGVATGFVTIPVLTKPVIALRGGGKKLYGNFPYFDAAFIGGGSSFRTEHRHRYAGDASVYGSAELRVPIIRFPTLLPTDVGALAFTDAARVYVDDESPGGWHTATGAGFWIGAIDAGKNINVLFTNRSNRRVMVSLGFAY